jgi:hypothetical protein
MARVLPACGHSLGWALAVGLLWGPGSGAGAQQRLAGQCPLIGPEGSTAIQPRRIQPSQVAEKNAMGCLSPADAHYGPDGCPLRMCGQQSGAFRLPAPSPAP